MSTILAIAAIVAIIKIADWRVQIKRRGIARFLGFK